MTTSAIEVYREKPFEILYDLPKETNLVLCIGGRGGMKTYEVSKFCTYSATIKKKRCVILRDEKELIKETILNEILTRYDVANEFGGLDTECTKLKTGIADKKTGKELVYTKGFRASANEKKANMKGVSDIDIAIIEEAEDLRNQDEFDTFVDGLRKEGCLVIIMMNTPDLGHFLIKRYFNAETTNHDGYFKLTPKYIEGFVCIQTGYEDNKYLPQHVINRYTGYGDPEHHLYNLHHYLTAILGYASAGRKGQILTKAKPIKLIDYFKLPYREYYGQDFGTASPAGLIGLKKHRNTIWTRQINYKPMSTLEIGKLYCTLKMNASDMIVADSADDKACTKLSTGWQGHELDQNDFRVYPGLRNGWNIIRARKGIDSVTYGINLLNTMNLFVVEESTDFWNEIYNYVYAQDKYGNYTNDPIDDFNHLIDPLRYVTLALDNNADSWGIERTN